MTERFIGHIQIMGTRDIYYRIENRLIAWSFSPDMEEGFTSTNKDFKSYIKHLIAKRMEDTIEEE